MTHLSKSYRKVRYDLRPAKQVERLIIIDALRRLNGAGFAIDTYQYTGMGSVHFYEFGLFHRYVGITRMLSVEASKRVQRRVKFNQPFDLVGIEMSHIGSVIPRLSKEVTHLLWLDYDSTMREEYVADTSQAIINCRPGSILLVTVDVEPPKGIVASDDLRDHYEAEFGEFLPTGLKLADFTPRNLAKLNSKILGRAIERGLEGLQGIEFETLFNFVYEDGHKMLTVGGMITDQGTRARLLNSSLLQAPYVRRSLAGRHYRISVPVLTRKERMLLDSHMPAKDGWKPKEFEISKRDLDDYRRIYRYAPNYAELIM